MARPVLLALALLSGAAGFSAAGALGMAGAFRSNICVAPRSSCSGSLTSGSSSNKFSFCIPANASSQPSEEGACPCRGCSSDAPEKKFFLGTKNTAFCKI